jgi:beta-glucosidase
MRAEIFPKFPEDFTWGVATASFQIEGATTADGRGPSIWDTFCAEPGRVTGDDTGDVACDHYHRYRDDVALMADLGVNAYRFSVAWPRVQPDGRGDVNRRGLDFYAALVDELLSKGIRPCATLYHWDLPQPLENGGGWRSRDTAERFADYAAAVHQALGDRVAMWMTLNEPFCSSFLGYAQGRHAPGAHEGEGALAAGHNLLVGHGLALRAMSAQRRGDELFGITLNLNSVTPRTDSPEDAAAARRAECMQNRSFTDPLLAGRYPEAEDETWGALTDFGYRQDGDLDLIGAPMDFLGVNTYFPQYVRAAPPSEADPARRTADDIGVLDDPPPSLPRSSMGWPVEAATMNRVMRWLRDSYPDLPPIYVTENGGSFPDVLRHDGNVPDPDRIDYLDGHLRALHEAMADGVDVRGYFCWSLLDNFEWAYGYSQRFGLVYVDYPTQRRIPKASFSWYRNVVRRHG